MEELIGSDRGESLQQILARLMNSYNNDIIYLVMVLYRLSKTCYIGFLSYYLTFFLLLHTYSLCNEK